MKKNQSVERAFHLLELLDSRDESGGIGLNDLARLSGLKPPTVHNFLQTLVGLGYVVQDEHSRYDLTPRVKWLGWCGSRKLTLISAARPHLEKLAAELNESVILCAASGVFWQTLLHYESSRILTARSRLPMSPNFYISATGRCILGSFSMEELENYLTQYRFPSPAEWPGAETKEGLLEKLAKIRRDRYELYETDSGVTGVGAMIRPFAHAATGALGVIVPTFRFTGPHRDSILGGILDAAAKIPASW